MGPTPVPANVQEATRSRWQLWPCKRHLPLGPQLQGASLAIVSPNGSSGNPAELAQMLDELEKSATVALFLLPPQHESAARSQIAGRKGQFLCLRNSAPAAELSAKLAAAAELQPVILHLQQELAAARQEGEQAGASVESLNEEMRLAARLQRDFLPQHLPEVGAIRFGVLFRPVTWVSGDIYDVVRLDETHIGFYVVDAVGHGMPAALLTMFIKKALQTKRIVGRSYEIVPPHVSLAELNSDICQQSLPSCQFCTAVYGVIDTAALTLTFARAGHPEPLLLHSGSHVRKLEASGSLLGVFPEEVYHSTTVQLKSGDRLLLYTDGAEFALRTPDADLELATELCLIPRASMPRDELILHLTAFIDQQDPAPPDDITIMVVDVARP